MYYSSTYNEWRRPDETAAHNTNTQQMPQTDKKHLTNLTEYFVGVIKLALYCVKESFLFGSLNGQNT
jgi:hypothetical protein